MIQYLPYIFGTVSFLGGIWLFLFSFKIYEPKSKTDDQKERITKTHSKFGNFLKIISQILIINGAYDLIARNSDRYRILEGEKTEWKASDRKALIDKCMKNVGTGEKYPKITKDYCECTSKRIMEKMTYSKYLEVNKKPMEERRKILKSVAGKCLEEFKTRINNNRNH